MCPICGTPLGLATESPQAQDEREFIQRLIDDCRSKDEIKTALVAQYGERVLALPGDEGGDDDLGDVLVYVIPALAVLLGSRRDRLRGAALAPQRPGGQAARRRRSRRGCERLVEAARRRPGALRPVSRSCARRSALWEHRR